MPLRPMSAYGIGSTPLHAANRYCPRGSLTVKLEGYNCTGSSKDRLAHVVLASLPPPGSPGRPEHLCDSTSGNLGIAMANLAGDAGVGFTALVDDTTVESKLARLRALGCDVRIVPRDDHEDARSARIAAARTLGRRPGWLWLNQYDNDLGFHVHFRTTGAEIWEQSRQTVRRFVCSIGTGATICGVGAYLKSRDPTIEIIGVEPEGSTIFGGEPFAYLNAGAGMMSASGLVVRFGGVIDSYCKVSDAMALRACRLFGESESASVGITSGAALHVGRHFARLYPNEPVVVLAADSGVNYTDFLDRPPTAAVAEVVVHPVRPLGLGWRNPTQQQEPHRSGDFDD